MSYLLISAIIPKLFLVIQAPLVYGEIIRRCFANISLVDFLLKTQEGRSFALQAPRLCNHKSTCNYIARIGIGMCYPLISAMIPKLFLVQQAP
jgi:hypothetical protein